MLANTPGDGESLAKPAIVPFSEPTIARKACMNCGGDDLRLFLDLDIQPNGNNFILESEIENEPTYSMRMLTCATCWQCQIDEFPSQDVLFSDHPYVSGLNVPVVEHFQTLAQQAVMDFGLGKGDVVLDIGCNDGSLLSAFRDAGLTTIGVDPGQRVTDLARQNGHMACRAFWNRDTALAVKQLGIRPKIITATAVFYHVPDLHDFIEGLAAVMDNDTAFVVQGVNLRDLITNLQFDHFYHEHSCIHSVNALQRLFAGHGMRILDVTNYDIHGGSFVAYIAKKDCGRPTTKNVERALQAERTAGLDKFETYVAFADAVRENTDRLKELLLDLKEQGKSVFGLGAPVKGSTLLNYAGIGPELVSCLTEVNGFKIGRLSPGTHIPVVDESSIEEEPDYYLVLAWNFVDFFLRKKRSYIEQGGKFIVPVPSLQVIDSASLSGEGLRLDPRKTVTHQKAG